MKRFSVPTTVLALGVALFAVSWLTAAPRRAEMVPAVNRAPFDRRGASPVASAIGRPQVTKQNGGDPVAAYGFRRDHTIALTFDDGPHPVHTSRLLGILREHQVTATFFVNGYWLDPGRHNGRRARDVLLRAVREGHTIGNHTYSHKLLSRLSKEQQTWQIVANELLLSELLGERTRLFRPPYGVMTAHAERVLRRYDYVETMWNVTAADQELHDPQRIASAVLGWIEAYRGGIVLLHDRHSWSVAATELLLRELRRRNCRRLAQQRPIYRVLPLERFLERPPASGPLARAAEQRRQAARRRMQKLCGQPASHESRLLARH